MKKHSQSELVESFQKLTTLAFPSGGQLLLQANRPPAVLLEMSQRNLTPKFEETKKTLRYYSAVNSSLPSSYKPCGPPLEITDLVFFAVSPSGRKSLRIRAANAEQAKKGETPEYLLELWDEESLLKTLHTRDKHGALYLDPWFRHADIWSPDEQSVIYVAETPRVKSCSFFDPNAPETTVRGGEFSFVEEWGEQYEGKASSSLFQVNFETDTISNVWPDQEKELTVGQVAWSPDCQYVSFVGWPSFPERLGMKYCYNRQCKLFLMNLKDRSCSVISSDLHAASAPKFAPDSKKVYFLGSNEKNTHGICSMMWTYDIESKASERIIDIVDVLQTPEGFPGLFTDNIHFLTSDELVLSSAWHSASPLIKISLKDKKVEKFSPIDKYLQWQIFDVKDGVILAAASAPNAPPVVYLISGDTWDPIITPNYRGDKFLERIQEISWKVHTLGDFPSIYQYIEITPTKVQKEPSPLIVFPHGGPHSVFVGNFSLPLAWLSLLGYSIILINFRGSTGFGKGLIDALPGKCGDLDVSDCFSCLDHALSHSTFKYEPSKIVYEGGSHSGFLGAWMIAKQPDRFQAAVLRNPVINISNMFGVTDIPDWCLVESGASSPNETEKMFACSPLSQVDKVKTPTLLLLGAKDKRVPPSQGIQFYKQLRKQNVDVRLKLYPNDCHPIASVKAEGDVWIHSVLFWEEFLFKN